MLDHGHTEFEVKTRGMIASEQDSTHLLTLHCLNPERNPKIVVWFSSTTIDTARSKKYTGYNNYVGSAMGWGHLPIHATLISSWSRCSGIGHKSKTVPTLALYTIETGGILDLASWCSFLSLSVWIEEGCSGCKK